MTITYRVKSLTCRQIKIRHPDPSEATCSVPHRRQISRERANPLTNEWVAHVSPLRHEEPQPSTSTFLPNPGLKSETWATRRADALKSTS
jgi:hypothetical protein